MELQTDPATLINRQFILASCLRQKLSYSASSGSAVTMPPWSSRRPPRAGTSWTLTKMTAQHQPDTMESATTSAVPATSTNARRLRTLNDAVAVQECDGDYRVAPRHQERAEPETRNTTVRASGSERGYARKCTPKRRLRISTSRSLREYAGESHSLLDIASRLRTSSSGTNVSARAPMNSPRIRTGASRRLYGLGYYFDHREAIDESDAESEGLIANIEVADREQRDNRNNLRLCERWWRS